MLFNKALSQQTVDIVAGHRRCHSERNEVKSNFSVRDPACGDFATQNFDCGLRPALRMTHGRKNASRRRAESRRISTLHCDRAFSFCPLGTYFFCACKKDKQKTRRSSYRRNHHNETFPQTSLTVCGNFAL